MGRSSSDYNDKVQSVSFALDAIQRQARYKGFLGPSIRDDDKVPSVGIRAARAAGVVVDDAGKMRCPPGTPNANQFTDLQMSNCMVPGAGATADVLADAGRAIMRQSSTDIFKGGVSTRISRLPAADKEQFAELSRRVNGIAEKVGMDEVDKGKALAIATSVGYWVTYLGADKFGLNDLFTGIMDSDNADGLAMLGDIFAVGGSAAIKRTFQQMQEVWGESKEKIDGYVESFNEKMKQLKVRSGEMSEKLKSGMDDIFASVKSVFKGERRKAPKNPVEAAQETASLFPNLPNVAPEKSARPDSLFQVTVNPNQYETATRGMKTSLLAKHLPEDKRDRPMREIGDELMKNMGMTDARPLEEQLTSGINLFEQRGPALSANLRSRIETTQDPQMKQRLAALALNVDDSLKKLETPEGREQVKTEMAEQFLEILAGHESTLERFPALRGRQVIEIYDEENNKSDAAGYAGMRVLEDGTIKTYCYYNPQTLIAGISDGDEEAGDVFANTVRLAGVDSYQTETAIHESGHTVHYAANLRSYGIDIGSDKPLIEQLKQNGDSLGSSHMGALFALRTNKPLDTSIDDLSDGEKSEFAKYVLDRSKAIPDVIRADSLDTEDSHKRKASFMLPPVKSENADSVRFALISEKGIDSNLYTGIPEGLDTPEGFDKFVKEKTGLTTRELVTEIHASMSEDLGVDARYVATGGMTPNEVMATMGSMSTYAGTIPIEAVAEAFTMDALLSRVTDNRVQSPEQLRLMQGSLRKVTREGQEFRGLPAVSERTANALSMYMSVINAPEFSGMQRGEVDLA